MSINRTYIRSKNSYVKLVIGFVTEHMPAVLTLYSRRDSILHAAAVFHIN